MSASLAPSNTGVAIGTPCRRLPAELDQFVLAQRLDGLVLAVHLLEDLAQRLEILLVGVDRTQWQNSTISILSALERPSGQKFGAKPKLSGAALVDVSAKYAVTTIGVN